MYLFRQETIIIEHKIERKYNRLRLKHKAKNPIIKQIIPIKKYIIISLECFLSITADLNSYSIKPIDIKNGIDNIIQHNDKSQPSSLKVGTKTNNAKDILKHILDIENKYFILSSSLTITTTTKIVTNNLLYFIKKYSLIIWDFK